MDRPDIYSDGVRPERCANCGHVRTTVFRSASCGAHGDGDPMDARGARPMEPGACPDTGGGGLMDTMEDILADCNEVFRYDDTRPQDRAHTYLKEHRVCRGYDDTAMERAAQDMIDRAYTVGRMESSKAVARETARIIAEGIAKELGITPGEE